MSDPKNETAMVCVMLPDIGNLWINEYRVKYSTCKLDVVFNLEHHPLFSTRASKRTFAELGRQNRITAQNAAQTSRNLRKLSHELKKLG